MSQETSSARIVAYLRDAALTSGDKLPAEVEMAKELGLSRNSIREAYAQLEAKGLLVRRHGIGTFVARTRIINDFGNSRTFWGMIEDSGATPSLRTLAQDVVQADADLADHMSVPPGSLVKRLRWLFCADGRPVVLIDHFLGPYIRIDGIDWQVSRNLLAALSDQIGGEQAELETCSTAVNASEAEAALLGLEPGLAILRGFAKVHAPDGRVPIVSRHWSNPKLFSIAHRRPLSARLLV